MRDPNFTHDFDGKVILITGGASGMGLETAKEVAGRGADVWIADINGDAADQEASALRISGFKARAIRLDVGDWASWLKVAQSVQEEHGKLDGLVNNAGVTSLLNIEDTSPEEWDRVMRINITGVFYGMKACKQLLAAATNASLVNMSSGVGMLGHFTSAYAASKWAVRGITKTAAVEFAKAGVRVNSVHPGLIVTPMLEKSLDSATLARPLQAVPAGRPATPDEVSSVIAFLLSESGSYINATEIVVDGGMIGAGTYHHLMST